jgi:aspartate aminotransferase
MSPVETAVPIELSQRVTRLRPSATLAVSARVKALQNAGVDVIGFGAGEPDFDTPGNIKRAAIEALEAGKTGYAPVPGEASVRRVIAKKLSEENGIECSADDIVISTGAKQSIYLALQCLLDPGMGQQVIVPTPAWVSFFPMVELAGGEVVEVECSVANDFRMTAAQLETAINERTRAIILNSPSNPCGTMYSGGELAALADVLARHENVAIISDEIYEKLVFGDEAHVSIGSLPQVADRTITINGLSKAYAMTGWRLGYACAPAPTPAPAPGHGHGLAKAMAKLQGQMTTSITTFLQPAIIEALTNSAEEVEGMRRTFARRAIQMHGLVSAMPGVLCPKPTGAFYVFPDVSAHFNKTTPQGRRIVSALSFAEALLEEAKVAVVPGEDFGAIGPCA